MAKCKGCGIELIDGTVFCPYCGSQVQNSEEQSVEGNVDFNSQIDNQEPTTILPKKEKGAFKIFALIGMIFGIVVLSFTGLALMNFATPILGLYLSAFTLEFSLPGMIFSIIGKKSNANHGKAIFGFIANLLCLILSFILLFVFAFLFIEEGGMPDDLYGNYYF